MFAQLLSGSVVQTLAKIQHTNTRSRDDFNNKHLQAELRSSHAGEQHKSLQRYFRRPNRRLTNSSRGRRLNSSSDMGVTQRSVLKTLSPTCRGKSINIFIYKRTSCLKWHSRTMRESPLALEDNVTFHPGTSFIITASSSRFSRSSRKVLKQRTDPLVCIGLIKTCESCA